MRTQEWEGREKGKKGSEGEQKKEREGAPKMERIASDSGRKRREAEKRRCVGGLLLGQPPPLPQPPLTG